MTALYLVRRQFDDVYHLFGEQAWFCVSLILESMQFEWRVSYVMLSMQLEWHISCERVRMCLLFGEHEVWMTCLLFGEHAVWTRFFLFGEQTVWMRRIFCLVSSQLECSISLVCEQVTGIMCMSCLFGELMIRQLRTLMWALSLSPSLRKSVVDNSYQFCRNVLSSLLFRPMKIC